MMLDVLRMVTDWLGHATYGVAAQLSALDYDGSDTTPVGTLQIVDESRDEGAAIGQYPSAWSLIVALQPVDQLVGQSAQYTHEADVPVLIRVKREDSNPAHAIRDLLYTLRATTRSIEALFTDSNATGVAARTRNQVQALFYTALGQALTREQRDDHTVTAAIAVTIRARDLLS